MTSQITGISIVCSTVCSGGDQRKQQSSTSLDFVTGIHRWPVDSPHEITRKMFPFDDVIMQGEQLSGYAMITIVCNNILLNPCHCAYFCCLSFFWCDAYANKDFWIELNQINKTKFILFPVCHTDANLGYIWPVDGFLSSRSKGHREYHWCSGMAVTQPIYPDPLFFPLFSQW